MAVSIAGTATLGEAASAQSVTCNVPAGVLAGQLLVAQVTHSTDTAVPDQTDWVSAKKANGGTASTATFYRYATASEPASYTFTGLNPSAAGRVTAEMVRLTGVDSTTPLDVPGDSKVPAAGTTITTDALVTVTDGTLVLYGVSRANAAAGSTINGPAEVTKVVETTGTGRRTVLFSEARPTAGDTGTRTFTATDGNNLGGAATNVAFRPATAAPATAPVVNAGDDASLQVNDYFARTAAETDGGAAITARSWTIVSGPAGAGTTIGTAAALSWTPTVAGSYVLRYSATNSVGTSTDDVSITVAAPPGASSTVFVAGFPTVGESASATQVTCAVPAETTAGEVLVAAVTHAVNVDVPDQAGWTTISKVTPASGNLAHKVFYRIATASEPASYTFTGLSAGRVTAEMVRLAGVDTAAIYDVAPASNSTGGTSVKTSAVTTVTNGALIIYTATRANAVIDIVAPSDVTLLAHTTGSGRTTHLASFAVPSSGVVGTRTWTAGSGDTASLSMATTTTAFRPTTGGPTALAPTVSAGADASIAPGAAFVRTATEAENGAAITARSWTIVSGPSGVGTTISTTATLSWTPSANGSYTLRYSATNAQGVGTDDVQVDVTPRPAGTLVSLWTGVPDGDSTPVVVRTANAASVRLLVGTNAAVTVGTFYTPAVTLDADGYAQPILTGLTAGTAYWYKAEIDGVLDPQIGSLVTDTPRAARSFRVAFGSCLTSGNADATAFNNMVANAPELFLHLGDFFYGDSSSTNPATHRGFYESAINTNTGLRTVLRSVPTGYITSDHDCGPNDWTGGPGVQTPAWNTAIRQVMPTQEALPSGGIYRSVHRGRVKFILTDGRSFKSDKAAPDDQYKTMFGWAQEAWIANELADPNYPVKIIGVDVPWVYKTTAGDDKWGGYKAAAQRLVDAITAAGANVFLIHGDAHLLCADDGTSANNTGGLPVAGAAPFGNSTSMKGGPYSQGTWPTSGAIGTNEQQHGLLDITDTGTAITVRFSGRDKTNTERVTLSKTFAAPAYSAQGVVARSVAAAPAGSTADMGRSVEVTVTDATVAAAAPAGVVFIQGPTPYTAAGPVARAWAVAPEGAVRALQPFGRNLAGPLARLTVAAWPGYVTPDSSRKPIVVDESGFDITVYSNTYATLGRIGDYISASVTWEWLAAGTGQIIVPADHWVVPYALTCNTTVVPVVIEVNGIRWTGRIASAQREHGADGTGTATLSLVDDWAWLQSVLAWPTPTAGIVSQTNAKSSATGKLATVSAALINDNMARLAAPVLALAPITDTSATVVIEARMELLSDYLVPLFQVQNWNLTATLWLPGDPQPVGYYAPLTGSLTRVPSTLTKPTVLITPTPNLSKPWVRWDDTVGGVITDSVGVVDPKGYKTVLAGSGTGTARIFAQYIDSDLGNRLGSYGFPEVFAEVSQGDTLTAVQAQGPAEASKNLGAASVAVTVQDGMPWRFGQHYFIGDMPRVELSGVALIDKPVTSVTASDNPDSGLLLVPTIGDNKATATSDAMIVDVVQRIAAQVRRLQTGK